MCKKIVSYIKKKVPNIVYEIVADITGISALACVVSLCIGNKNMLCYCIYIFCISTFTTLLMMGIKALLEDDTTNSQK